MVLLGRAVTKGLVTVMVLSVGCGSRQRRARR